MVSGVPGDPRSGDTILVRTTVNTELVRGTGRKELAPGSCRCRQHRRASGKSTSLFPHLRRLPG